MRSSNGPGRLLDKVGYCMRKPCSGTNIIDEKITIRDTFPYNPESKTAPETAKKWADERRYGDTGEYIPQVIVRDNEPFTVTITDLHVRSEGGRAYKVVDADMRCFDLREDQVLEVMKLCGILPGGSVPGSFVWGILGSQVRLVLVDGELHKMMIDGAQNKKDFEARQDSGAAPSPSSLIPGHVYRKKDGSLHVFLGRCTAPFIDKSHYAFIEMPVNEGLTDMSTFSDRAEKRYIDATLRRNEFLKTWDTLTWRRRCRDRWVDHYKIIDAITGGKLCKEKVYASPIVFMSTPKFDADVGTVETDFFDDMKGNTNNWHTYKKAGSAYGEDLTFKWAQQNTDLSNRDAVKRGYWTEGEGSSARCHYNKHIKWI